MVTPMRILGRLLGRPVLIPIAHEPEYHTDTIGTYEAGQFIANIHGAQQHHERWKPGSITRWFAYVHRFDHSGNHVSSDIRPLGTGPGLPDRELAETTLTELLNQLADRRFGDIRIKLFRVMHDGVLFGLVDETGLHGLSPWAELYPEGLGFHRPWDGEYDT